MRNPQDNLRRLLQKMEARYGSEDVHVQQLRDELNTMNAAPPAEPAPAPTPMTASEMPQINFHFDTMPVQEQTFPRIKWPQGHDTTWLAAMK